MPDLFGAPPLRLADDAGGGIEYRPGLIGERKAQRWFEALLAQVDWRFETRPMYDREVIVPRGVAAFSLSDPKLLPILGEAGAEVRSATATAFNHVGLNLYRDGRDSVAPHGDRIGELREGAPIAVLSLGDARRMTITSAVADSPYVDGQPGRTRHIDLEPGSLFLMSYLAQQRFLHGIPKTDAPVGARISLAFRIRRGVPDLPL